MRPERQLPPRTKLISRAWPTKWVVVGAVEAVGTATMAPAVAVAVGNAVPPYCSL